MGGRYSQLSVDERNPLQGGLNAVESMRAMARVMHRRPGPLSRECRRGGSRESQDAVRGREWAGRHRRRGPRKLVPGSPLTEQGRALILERAGSPEPVAGRLRVEHPEDTGRRVSHETLYPSIHAHPAGELEKRLVDALRQGHRKRQLRGRGQDRRGGIRNMRSLQERPAGAQSGEIPCHWEGDLIKGACNGSAMGTRVDRRTRFVILAKRWWTLPPKRCWKASPGACARFPMPCGRR